MRAASVAHAGARRRETDRWLPGVRCGLGSCPRFVILTPLLVVSPALRNRRTSRERLEDVGDADARQSSRPSSHQRPLLLRQGGSHGGLRGSLTTSSVHAVFSHKNRCDRLHPGRGRLCSAPFAASSSSTPGYRDFQVPSRCRTRRLQASSSIGKWDERVRNLRAMPNWPGSVRRRQRTAALSDSWCRVGPRQPADHSSSSAER